MSASGVTPGGRFKRSTFTVGSERSEGAAPPNEEAIANCSKQGSREAREAPCTALRL